MCSRLSTTPSWQRRIGNKITSSRSRLESKFSIWYFHLWLRAIAVYQCPVYGCIVAPIYPSYDLDHQKISGNPWLHLRGRHGRDDQLGETRPQSCLRLRPGGLQGPQGQLSKRSCSFDISGVLRSQDYLFYQKAANKTCWSSVLAVSFSILCWLWISSRSPNVHRLC